MINRVRLAGRSLYRIVAVLSLTACGDAILSPVTPRSTSAGKEVSPQQSRAEELAVSLARALSAEVLREKIRNDLQASTLTHEHKLIAQRYLPSNEALLTSASRAAGQTNVEFAARLAELPLLEIYLPVREHRENWTPDQPLLVAVQLDEDVAPIAFDGHGRRIVLSNVTPPTVPVLSVVPAESERAPQLPSVRRNIGAPGTVGTWTFRKSATSPPLMNLAGGQTLSETPPECDPLVSEECPEDPSGPPAVAYPAGIYLSWNSINDLGESWAKGDPEIQAFVIGPTYHPSNDGELISCSGQSVAGSKAFDQNGNTWNGAYWFVEGLLLSKTEIDSIRQIYSADFAIQFWEDDDESCEINSDDRSTIEALAANLQAAYRATSILIGVVSGRIELTPSTALAFREAAFDAFKTRDDFLGLVVHTPGTRTIASAWETVSADLAKPNGSNGTVSLITYY